jgi:tRNA threonylcarbamoyladenosine biosynthesis protein TsaE
LHNPFLFDSCAEQPLILQLADETATLALGKKIANILHPGLIVFLNGDLGAGKTTLTRGILRAMGYQGKVKSPTYNLVEIYKFSGLYLYHFDFYRFDNAPDWDDTGFAEVFRNDTVCLVEWPERVAQRLPAADLSIMLAMRDEGLSGRQLTATAATEAGERCLSALATELRA